MNILPTGPSWAEKCVNYGKGRCAHVPKSQQAAVEAVQAAAAQSLIAHTSFSPIQGQGNFRSPMTPYSSQDDSGGMDEMNGMNDLSGLNGNQPLNRMIYLGDIHPETSTEDLCNTIGGASAKWSICCGRCGCCGDRTAPIATDIPPSTTATPTATTGPQQLG